MIRAFWNDRKWQPNSASSPICLHRESALFYLTGILKMADRVGYSDSLVKQIAAIEIAAEDVLADRQHIVELDRKRNGTREALRLVNVSLLPNL